MKLLFLNWGKEEWGRSSLIWRLAASEREGAAMSKNVFCCLLLSLFLFAASACNQPASVDKTPTAGSPATSPTAVAVQDEAAPEAGKGELKPGIGVAKVALGQSKDEVEKVLGEPQDRDINEFSKGQSFSLYYEKGMELSFNDDKLAMITLHRAGEQWKDGYRGSTDEGIWVGSSPASVEAALGSPSKKLDRALQYDDLGLWFRLDGDGRVESISVIPPQEKSEPAPTP